MNTLQDRLTAVPKIKTTLCAIYTRKSTDEGLNGDFSSLDSQREYCENFVKARGGEGWQIYPERYDDGGFSGGNANRPGLKKLLADAKEKKFNVVVCYKYDRLSRNTRDFLQILEVFDESEVAFVSVTQPIDTTSSVGRLMRSILMDFSQFEREVIAERTRDKLNAMAKRGKRTGGHPILGYDIVPETKVFKVNPEEKGQVLEMFDTYIRTKSLSVTARQLTEKGYKMKAWVTRKGDARGGQKLTKSNLWYLLQNQIYIGKISHRRKIFQGEHEGIVPEETFNQAQDLLRVNGDGKFHRRLEDRKHTFLLRGLVRCACCNTTMTPFSALSKKHKEGYRRFFYYKCLSVVKGDKTACKVKYVRAEALENWVVRRLEDLSKNQAVVEEIVKEGQNMTTSVLPQKLDDKKRLTAEMGRVKLEMETLMGVLAREGTQSKTYAVLIEKLGTLKDQRDEVEMKISALNIEIQKLEEETIDASIIRRNLGNFVELFKRLDNEQRQEIIALLIGRVIWDGLGSWVTLELRPAHRLFGDMNLLEGSFDYRPITLPEGYSNQNGILNLKESRFEYSKDRLPECYSIQNILARFRRDLLERIQSSADFGVDDPLKIDHVNVAKGRVQVHSPEKAHAIKSKQRRYKLQPEPQPPTVQVLLKKAYAYQKVLEENSALTRDALAKQEGISPPFLTRILHLIKLAPEIQREIFAMPSTIYQTPINERRLKHIARIPDCQLQIEAFNRLKKLKPRARLRLRPPELQGADKFISESVETFETAVT